MAIESLFFSPKNTIGGIEIAATLEEVHVDALQTSEHPVELGAPITDHAYNLPSELVIRSGWSNSSLEASTGAITALFGSGEVSQADYISSIYSQLLALKESRTPFDVVTARRKYSNMLMVGLAVTTDNETSQVLSIECTCRQIIIVATQATTLPPKENQANPASTAEPKSGGVKWAIIANPSSGGAYHP